MLNNDTPSLPLKPKLRNPKPKKLLLLHHPITRTMPSPLPPPPFFILSLLLLMLFPTSLPLPANPQPGTMAESELDTLFMIMESMSSDQVDWRSSYPNPCSPGSSSWPGIECKPGDDDSYMHVSRLDFGTPPNPSCKQTAIFPHLIFSLPFLQSAFFFHCFNQAKTAITVPATVNSSLQQLSLRSNPALAGPIPPQISSLKSLQVLTLSQNRHSGDIPLGLFSLTSLMHLDLSYNSLTGTLPARLGDLKNLIGLDLSYNLLSGIIPSAIGQLGRLQKLDLSSNSLTGPIPESIENLGSLVFLAVSNNGLTGKLPSGISKLQNLECFIMESNPVNMPLPIGFGSLARLQELRLSNSGYSGPIPPSFSRLANLSTLSLQNNQLTGEIPPGFGNLSHIYHLNLSRNSLSGVVPFEAGFLSRLGKNLDLSGNPGLCLNPTETYNVKVGVDLCNNGTFSSLFSQSPSSNPNQITTIFLLHALSYWISLLVTMS